MWKKEELVQEKPPKCGDWGWRPTLQVRLNGRGNFKVKFGVWAWRWTVQVRLKALLQILFFEQKMKNKTGSQIKSVKKFLDQEVRTIPFKDSKLGRWFGVSSFLFLLLLLNYLQVYNSDSNFLLFIEPMDISSKSSLQCYTINPLEAVSLIGPCSYRIQIKSDHQCVLEQLRVAVWSNAAKSPFFKLTVSKYFTGKKTEFWMSFLLVSFFIFSLHISNLDQPFG